MFHIRTDKIEVKEFLKLGRVDKGVHLLVFRRNNLSQSGLLRKIEGKLSFESLFGLLVESLETPERVSETAEIIKEQQEKMKRLEEEQILARKREAERKAAEEEALKQEKLKEEEKKKVQAKRKQSLGEEPSGGSLSRRGRRD